MLTHMACRVLGLAFSDRLDNDSTFLKEFKKHTASQNQKWLTVFSKLILLFGVTTLIYYYLHLFPEYGSPAGAYEAGVKNTLVLLVIASTAFLVLTNIFKKRETVRSVINPTFILLYIGCFCFFSINAQQNHGSIAYATAAAFVSGVVLYINTLLGLLIYFALMPGAMFAVYLVQPDPSIGLAKVSLFAGLVFFSWVVSRFFYHYRVNNFHVQLQLKALQKDYSVGFEIAAQLQENLVSNQELNFGTLKLTALWLPSGRIGGNLTETYDFGDERHTGFFFCDVFGQGAPAALALTSIKSILATLKGYRNNPVQFIEQINAHFLDQIPGNYFGCFYGIVDSSNNSICYVLAGLPFPCQRTNGRLEVKKVHPGAILGGKKQAALNEYTLTLHPGEMLLIYNHGLNYQRNRQGLDFAKYLKMENDYEQEAFPRGCSLTDLSGLIERFSGNEKFSDDIFIFCFSGSNQ